ncbi:multiubiquitin domain-containing protein [Bradyrhizobium sp. LM2.9]
MTDNLEERGADPGVEEVLDEIIDLEEYAKLGKRPPLSKGYRILVNGDPFVVNEPNPTGRAILTLAGLLPAENYTLRVKICGRETAEGWAQRARRSSPPGRREVQSAAA